MELNNTMSFLLECLLDNQQEINLSELCSKTGLKRQNINYTLGKLNEWLSYHNFSCVQNDGISLSLKKSEIEKIYEELKNCKISSYVFTPEERKEITFICIALSNYVISVNYLCDLFSVSRNTILNELSTLKSELKDNKIKLSYKNKKGYQLSGDEQQIRNLLLDCLQSKSSIVINQLKKELLENFLDKSLTELLITIKNIFISEEKHFKLKFSTSSLNELSTTILIAHLRNKKGGISALEPSHPLKNTLLIAKDIISQLNQHNISIYNKEACYIAHVVMGARIYSWDQTILNENQNVMQLTKDLIDIFEIKACVTFLNKNELERQLFAHMLPMYYRLKYHLHQRNPLLTEIQSKYRDLYNLTDLSTKYIEKKYKISFTADEIAYLCVYLGGWLLKQSYESTGGKDKILILCGEGLGTSIFVKQQISQLLGNSYSYETKPEREFNDTDALNYKLIVSTVKLKKEYGNVLYVSPILTSQQKHTILHWSDINSPEDHQVGKLIEIVKKHTDVKNESKLIQDLAMYLHESENDSYALNIRLMDLLTPDYIQIIDEELDYKELVSRCCEPLVKNKVIGKEYATSILSVLQEFGLYSQIAPGILLLHAKPDSKVNGVGISFSIMHKPVKFSNSDFINMVFILASEDNRLHTMAIKDLLEIISDKKTLEKLNSKEIIDSDTIYKILNEKLS